MSVPPVIAAAPGTPWLRYCDDAFRAIAAQKLLPERGTPAFDALLSELFASWALSADSAAVTAVPNWDRLIAKAKCELVEEDRVALINAIDERAKKDSAQQGGGGEESTALLQRLRTMEMTLRLYFHARDDDRDTWVGVLRQSWKDTVELSTKLEAGWFNHVEFHVLFNLFNLIRISSSGLPQDDRVREQCAMALVETADHCRGPRGTATGTDAGIDFRTLAGKIREQGLGKWIVPEVFALGRRIGFNSATPWMRDVLSRSDATWASVPNSIDIVASQRRATPAAAAAPTAAPALTTELVRPAAGSATTTAAPLAPPPPAAAAPRHAISVDDDDATLTIGELIAQAENTRGVIGQRDDAATVGQKRPRVDLVVSSSRVPPMPGAGSRAAFARLPQDTHQVAPGHTAAAASSSASSSGHGRPCRSQYHSRYAAATSHASDSCPFCATCHLMEYLFNAASGRCCWNHGPTDRKVSHHLKAFPDVFSLAKQRLPQYAASGHLAAVQIPL